MIITRYAKKDGTNNVLREVVEIVEEKDLSNLNDSRIREYNIDGVIIKGAIQTVVDPFVETPSTFMQSATSTDFDYFNIPLKKGISLISKAEYDFVLKTITEGEKASKMENYNFEIAKK